MRNSRVGGVSVIGEAWRRERGDASDEEQPMVIGGADAPRGARLFPCSLLLAPSFLPPVAHGEGGFFGTWNLELPHESGALTLHGSIPMLQSGKG